MDTKNEVDAVEYMFGKVDDMINDCFNQIFLRKQAESCAETSADETIQDSAINIITSHIRQLQDFKLKSRLYIIGVREKGGIYAKQDFKGDNMHK